MQKSPIAMAVFLIGYYGIIDAHVVDVHLPTTDEKAMVETAQKNRENRKAEKVLDDSKSSRKEKREAMGKLIKNGRAA